MSRSSSRRCATTFARSRPDRSRPFRSRAVAVVATGACRMGRGRGVGCGRSGARARVRPRRGVERGRGVHRRAPSAGTAEPARRRRCVRRWGGRARRTRSSVTPRRPRARKTSPRQSSRSRSPCSSRSDCTSRSACPTARSRIAPGAGSRSPATSRALGLAAYLYTQRPDVPLGAARRRRRRRGAHRARRATSVAAAGRADRAGACSTPVGRVGRRWSRPRSRSARSCSTRCSRGRSRSPRSRSASTVLVPFSLAIERVRSARGAHRPAARAQHHARRSRRRSSAGRICSSCSASAAHPTGSEKTLLGLSMLAAAVAALALGSGARAARRARDAARLRRRPRTRRGAADVRQPADARAPARRAAAPARGVAQGDDEPRGRRGVDASGAGRPRARGVGARPRPGRRSRSVPRRRRSSRTPACPARRWAQVWLPAVLAGLEEPVLRTAPVTNSGELLGLIVVRRAQGALPFNEADDLALTELARQVGLALHNVKLDSALQESLDAVRRQADELRASRARIVEATDTERRRIERDLHDGAQQHLVALAVGVRLARQIADSDPEQAKDDARPDRARPPGGGAGAAQPRARHLPAAADGPRAPRRAARRRPDRAALADDGRGRGRRPLPAAGRGRGLLLLPRGAAERGQARGRGRERWS